MDAPGVSPCIGPSLVAICLLYNLFCAAPRAHGATLVKKKLEQADRYTRVICTNQVMGDIALDCFSGKIILPCSLLSFSFFMYLSDRIVHRYTQKKRKKTF